LELLILLLDLPDQHHTTKLHTELYDALPEGPKALEEDWERAGSGAALVLTNQWLL
jgi:hypothetical protein